MILLYSLFRKLILKYLPNMGCKFLINIWILKWTCLNRLMAPFISNVILSINYIYSSLFFIPSPSRELLFMLYILDRHNLLFWFFPLPPLLAPPYFLPRQDSELFPPCFHLCTAPITCFCGWLLYCLLVVISHESAFSAFATA